jgi:hypothetical protein
MQNKLEIDQYRLTYESVYLDFTSEIKEWLKPFPLSEQNTGIQLKCFSNESGNQIEALLSELIRCFQIHPDSEEKEQDGKALSNILLHEANKGLYETGVNFDLEWGKEIIDNQLDWERHRKLKRAYEQACIYTVYLFSSECKEEERRLLGSDSQYAQIMKSWGPHFKYILWSSNAIAHKSNLLINLKTIVDSAIKELNEKEKELPGDFYTRALEYWKKLDNRIADENELIIEPMLGRLEVASLTQNLNCDDMMMLFRIKLVSLQIDPRKIFQNPFEIQYCQLKEYAFNTFHTHILTHGSDLQKESLFKCVWFKENIYSFPDLFTELNCKVENNILYMKPKKFTGSLKTDDYYKITIFDVSRLNINTYLLNNFIRKISKSKKDIEIAYFSFILTEITSSFDSILSVLHQSYSLTVFKNSKATLREFWLHNLQNQFLYLTRACLELIKLKKNKPSEDIEKIVNLIAAKRKEISAIGSKFIIGNSIDRNLGECLDVFNTIWENGSIEPLSKEISKIRARIIKAEMNFKRHFEELKQSITGHESKKKKIETTTNAFATLRILHLTYKKNFNKSNSSDFFEFSKETLNQYYSEIESLLTQYNVEKPERLKIFLNCSLVLDPQESTLKQRSLLPLFIFAGVVSIPLLYFTYKYLTPSETINYAKSSGMPNSDSFGFINSILNNVETTALQNQITDEDSGEEKTDYELAIEQLDDEYYLIIEELEFDDAFSLLDDEFDSESEKLSSSKFNI